MKSFKIILTCDDFGMSPVFNKRILEMAKMAYLSSISVMVGRQLFEQINQFNLLLKISKENSISLGLHLEVLNQDVLGSCNEQWSLFVKQFGVPPAYIDIHKKQIPRQAYNEIGMFCKSKKIPFRKYSETSIDVLSPNNSIIATNYNLESLINLIKHFEEKKTYELIFHIGEYDPNCESKLNQERENDISKLTSIINFLKSNEVEITNYANLL